MARAFDQMDIRLGPCAVQIKGKARRARAVMAPMRNNAGHGLFKMVAGDRLRDLPPEIMGKMSQFVCQKRHSSRVPVSFGPFGETLLLLATDRAQQTIAARSRSAPLEVTEMAWRMKTGFMGSVSYSCGVQRCNRVLATGGFIHSGKSLALFNCRPA